MCEVFYLNVRKEKPMVCFTKNGEGKTVIVIRGEQGYHNVKPDLQDVDPDVINKELNVSREEARAMIIGSMFGWDAPGANI